METGKAAAAPAWVPLPGTTVRREVKFGPLGMTAATKLEFVRAVRFAPDGKCVLTAGVIGCTDGDEARHPTTWDAATGERLVSFGGEQFRDVLAVAYSPDGKLVAAADNAGVVREWDAATGRQRLVLRGHTDLVRTVAFSPDGTRLVTASDDRTARVCPVPAKR